MSAPEPRRENKVEPEDDLNLDAEDERQLTELIGGASDITEESYISDYAEDLCYPLHPMW